MAILTTIKKEGTAYDRFAGSISNPRTREEYTRQLLYYCEWKGVAKSIDELLRSKPVKIEEDVERYLVYLKEEKKIAHGSRRIVAASLKHFYTMNRIKLEWDRLNKFIGSVNEEILTEDKAYDHDQIAKILSISDMKYRAIILLMCSSGCRVGAIPGIQNRDITKMKGYDIYKVMIYGRTREEYYSFTTPEAYKAINEYLDFRQRSGEELVPKSPLFRLDFDPRDQDQVKNSKALSDRAIKSRIRHLLLRANIITEQPYSDENPLGRRRNEIKSTHGFRKFAITQMGKAGMDMEHREFLAGHTLGVRGKYLKYSEEDRLNEYLKAVDKLTIDASNRLRSELGNYKNKQEKEIAELRRENKEQAALIERISKQQESDSKKIGEMPHLVKRLWDELDTEYAKAINRGKGNVLIHRVVRDRIQEINEIKEYIESLEEHGKNDKDTIDTIADQKRKLKEKQEEISRFRSGLADIGIDMDKTIKDIEDIKKANLKHYLRTPDALEAYDVDAYSKYLKQESRKKKKTKSS